MAKRKIVGWKIFNQSEEFENWQREHPEKKVVTVIPIADRIGFTEAIKIDIGQDDWSAEVYQNVLVTYIYEEDYEKREEV